MMTTQMMTKQMMTKQMAKRKHTITIYSPQHDDGNDEEEDNNSLSDDCYCDMVNFPYEWDNTLYYSYDYTTLLHRFRQQARETDATKDSTASFETRCEQVNHLTYLQTCFQRMADDESCGCRELYNCHGSFIENEISAIESQINQLEQEQKQ